MQNTWKSKTYKILTQPLVSLQAESIFSKIDAPSSIPGIVYISDGKVPEKQERSAIMLVKGCMMQLQVI